MSWKRSAGLVLLAAGAARAAAPAAPPGSPAPPARAAAGAAAELKAENEAVGRTDLEMSEATAARDVERFLAFLADDATFVQPRMVVGAGREGVRRLWADLFRADGPSLRWRPTLSFVARSRDLAFTEGEYLSRARSADGREAAVQGRYAAIWRKQLDGSWKVVIDIGNNAPGPASSPRLREVVVRSETSKSGDLLYSLNAYELEGPGPTGQGQRRRGHYLVVRTRAQGGAWRQAANADPTPRVRP